MVKKEDKKKAFLDAMEKTFGNITQSCNHVGIHRSLPHKWAEDDKEFAAKAFDKEHYSEAWKDMVESGLTKLAVDKDKIVLMFLAKTKMKDRGYIERQEVNNMNSGMKLEINTKSKEQQDNMKDLLSEFDETENDE